VDSLMHISLAFLEGLGLIFSPCILPILPIILAGSLTGSKKRPLGIIIGFTMSFVLLTLFARKLVQIIDIDSFYARPTALALLFFLGIIMLSSQLSDKLAALTSRLENVGSSFSFNNNQSGFLGGILFGTLVTLVWTPCAGPILAAIIVQAVMQRTTLMSFWVLLAFTLGTALPMFVIAIFGRKIMSKLNFFKSRGVLFRKILGAVIILAVGYMAYSGGFIATAIAAETASKTAATLQDGLPESYPAPALKQISGWINSSPLALNKLKGKVILIDFWTYTCPHCVNTIPYVNDWHQKYHNKGLVIIGIHGPAYSEQASLKNVKDAVARLNIEFPIALDNEFATWGNYSAEAWPTFYLIDKNGNLVYRHAGEGDYDIVENNIQFLLQQAN
jgi:cytochrome c biogenesis protein CcdA/thiol-disulfide isomerase/thioredoxin